MKKDINPAVKTLLSASAHCFIEGWRLANPTYKDEQGYAHYYSTEWKDVLPEYLEASRILRKLAHELPFWVEVEYRRVAQSARAHG